MYFFFIKISVNEIHPRKVNYNFTGKFVYSNVSWQLMHQKQVSVWMSLGPYIMDVYIFLTISAQTPTHNCIFFKLDEFCNPLPSPSHLQTSFMDRLLVYFWKMGNRAIKKGQSINDVKLFWRYEGSNLRNVNHTRE